MGPLKSTEAFPLISTSFGLGPIHLVVVFHEKGEPLNLKRGLGGTDAWPQKDFSGPHNDLFCHKIFSGAAAVCATDLTTMKVTMKKMDGGNSTKRPQRGQFLNPQHCLDSSNVGYFPDLKRKFYVNFIFKWQRKLGGRKLIGRMAREKSQALPYPVTCVCMCLTVEVMSQNDAFWNVFSKVGSARGFQGGKEKFQQRYV